MGIAGSAAAAIGAASSMSFAFAGTAYRLNALKTATGLSFNELRGLESLAPRIGVSVESLDSGFESLNAHMERLRRNSPAELASMAATMFPNVRNEVAKLANQPREKQLEGILDIGEKIKANLGRGGGVDNEKRFLEFFGLPANFADYSKSELLKFYGVYREQNRDFTEKEQLAAIAAQTAWLDLRQKMQSFTDYVGNAFVPYLNTALKGVGDKFTSLSSGATAWFSKLVADPSISKSWDDLSTRVGADIKALIDGLSTFDDTATRPRVLPLSVAPEWVGFGQDIKNLITDADNVAKIVDDLNAKKINWAEVLNLADLTDRIASFKAATQPIVDWSDKMARLKWWLPGNQYEPPPSKDQPEGPTGPSVLDRLRSWFSGRSTGGPGRSPSGPAPAPFVLPKLGGMDDFSKPATAPVLPQFAPGYSPIAFHPENGLPNPLLDKSATSSSAGEAIAIIRKGVAGGLYDFFQTLRSMTKGGGGGIVPASYETGAGGSGGGAGGLGGGSGGTGAGRGGAGAGGPAGELGGAIRRHGHGGGGAGDSPYQYDASKAQPGSLTKLIGDAAERASKQPGAKLSADQIRREMEGIRAGESGHGPKYDFNPGTPGHPELSYGPFQMNRLRGFGVTFEHDTEAERKRLGLGDLRDPRTMQMQTDYLAKYLARGGSTAPWMGFHGAREADPRWGNSGLIPEKNVAVAGPVAPSTAAPRANIHIPNVYSQSGESSEYPAKGETSGALAKHGEALRKMFGHRGAQRKDGALGQEVRREPGSLLRAADARQAAVQKHAVRGEASLKIALASGLKPVGGVKSSGNLFKQIQLDRASPLPPANTTG